MNKPICKISIPPGKIILEEFLKPFRWSIMDLSARSCIPYNTLYDIIHEGREISNRDAAGLAKAFNSSVEFWINLEAQYRSSLPLHTLHPLKAVRYFVSKLKYLRGYVKKLMYQFYIRM
jgi:addiction module HigA family antidote